MKKRLISSLIVVLTLILSLSGCATFVKSPLKEQIQRSKNLIDKIDPLMKEVVQKQTLSLDDISLNNSTVYLRDQ